jgi:hypothetical protein
MALAGGAFVVGLVTAGYPLLVAVDNAEPGVGSFAVAVVGQVLPVVVCVALMVAGGFVWGRREVGDFGLAVAGVCAALLVGAANAALFSHAVAPITADGRWARLAVAAVLGGGFGLAGAGVLRLRRSMGAASRPAGGSDGTPRPGAG